MKNPSDAPPKNGVTVYVPPKVLSMIFAALIGGSIGGVGITSLVKGSGAEAKGHNSDVIDRETKLNGLENAVETNTVSIETNTQSIDALKGQTNAIQKVQHNDIARAEARRVTKEIINRRRRQEMEDRIYAVNLDRLRRGEPPCLDRSCSN